MASPIRSLDLIDIKKLKSAYFVVFLLVCFRSKNLFVVLSLNIVLDLSITLLYLKLKSKICKIPEVTNLKTLKSLDFDKVLYNTIPSSNMLLPFLLGFDGKKHIYADLSKFLHTLIAGRSGKGKSNFINQILQSLIYNQKGNLVLFLCDMKVVELCHDYACFPMCRTFSDADSLLTCVTNLRKEMQRRYDILGQVLEGNKSYKKIEDYNLTHDPLPYAVLLIDEFADLSYIQDESLKTKIWTEIKWVLREGRAAGIIIMLATQRPTKENIPASIKGLCVSFMGFGTRDNNESYYCGVKGSANLPIGEFVVAGEGEEFDNTKLKSYHIKPDDKIYYHLYNNYNKKGRDKDENII